LCKRGQISQFYALAIPPEEKPYLLRIRKRDSEALLREAQIASLTHLPRPEVSHYEFWLFADFGLAIAK
jgi:hypothetical protein